MSYFEQQSLIQSMFLEDLEQYFHDVTVTRKDVSFENDAEYMKVIEYKFLLKNLRELSSMQLYQIYSRGASLTTTVDISSTQSNGSNINDSSQKESAAASVAVAKKTQQAITVTDIASLKQRVAELDRRLVEIKALIDHRLSLVKSLPGAASDSGHQDDIIAGAKRGKASATTAAAAGKKGRGKEGKGRKGGKNTTSITTVLPIAPRILQFCRKLNLSPAETDLFHLMVIIQGSNNSFILNSMIEEDYLRRIMGFQRLCNLSEIDIELFCDGERVHIKEGLVLMEEDGGQHFNLRVPRTAVAVFYGKKVGADDLLKLSQTTLEAIIQDQFEAAYRLQEEGGVDGGSGSEGSEGEEEEEEEEGMEGDELAEEEEEDYIRGSNSSRKSSSNHSKKKRKLNDGVAVPPALVPVPASVGKLDRASLSKLLLTSAPASASASSSSSSSSQKTGTAATAAAAAIVAGMDTSDVDSDLPTDSPTSGAGIEPGAGIDSTFSSSLTAYDPLNQLEYLEEGFKLIALMVRGNAARLKDDMKKEGTRLSNWEGGTDIKHGKRELLAKLRVAEKKVARRVAITKEEGVLLPRLELLAERLGLDSFERKIILLLIGKTVSPVVRTLMDTLVDGSSSAARTIDDVISVGQALAILCEDFQTQVASRKYFYRSGRLLTNGIISLSKPRWHQGSGDLTDQKMAIDRRLLDWCVGLDSEINELVEGSDLYKPTVSLSQIVLPPGEIDTIVQQCKAYDQFCTYRVTSGMNKVLSYGSGLVILFCGKSGTGKTMTVNAIANELDKSVLLVDFSSLTGKREGNDIDADLRGLFREAQMSNAVLFFDECESVFRNRNSGGDRMLNALLTEIEKHEGIVFLATNRPYDLDEAMHRRINSVIEFRAPDSSMRRSIWRNLLCLREKELELEKEKEKEKEKEGGAGGEIVDSTSPGVVSTDATPAPVTKKPHPRHYLKTSDDVDVDAIAVKYELTGGFIKNAVVSATLAAIGRSPTDPVICQSDLVLGCKLQMRGSLTQRSTESKVTPTFGLQSVDMISSLKLALYSIIRYENTRACVYGSWGADTSGGVGGRDIGSSSSSTASSLTAVANAANTNVLEQRACIVTFAGPRGSGKRTLINCVAHELGRNVKLIHLGDLLSANSLAESMSNLESLLKDARLGDSLFALDGFESILDDSGSGSGSSQSSYDSSVGGHSVGGFKLQSVLSRMLTVLNNFPGLVVLIAHVDNPQSITLQRDFASSLYSFIRFTTPPSEIRALLWKRLLPPRMPVFSVAHKDENTVNATTTALRSVNTSVSAVTGASTLRNPDALNPIINFTELGKRFELNPGNIRSAVARACAEVAGRIQRHQKVLLRQKQDSTAAQPQQPLLYVTQQDLLAAGEAEMRKLKGSYNETLMNLFV